MNYRGRGRGGYRNNNATNNFGQNSVQQFANDNMIPVEILGWNGASADECVKFISRKCRIAILNSSVDPSTGILKGYVRNLKEANELVTWSGVRFSGQPLKISKAIASDAISGSTMSNGNSTVEVLSQFIRSRYNPDTRMLNLSEVQKDANLVSKGFFASMSTTSKFFPALMKVANELKLDVESIDLSSNQLSDLSGISSLTQTFPLLKNLSLSNNNLTKVRQFDSWKHKLNFLRELIIFGNPLMNFAKPDDMIYTKDEFLKCFPRLVVLNGEIIRNEEVLTRILHFPFDSPQSMFFQDAEIQGIATNFVANFFKLWDSNRQDLMILYEDNSQFSMQVDSAHPFAIDPKAPNSNTDFGYYIPQSRNLTRVSSVKSRMGRVARGNINILNAFKKLPKTKHELISKPFLFSMETYRYPQLNGIIIVLHGCFEEVAQPEVTENTNNTTGPKKFNHRNSKKTPLSPKSFDRTFLVLQGPTGGMIVASDLLLVRSFGGYEAFDSGRGPDAQTNAPINTNNSSIPTAADLPPEIKATLNPMQQEILVRVLLETKLNLQYSMMLCEQSNWNYDSCILNFKNSASSIPPEAFISQ